MNWARVFFGVLVVTLGLVLLLDNLGVLDAGDVISVWWPIALVVGGLLAFASNRRHWAVPLILFGGGVALLLRTTGVVDTLSVVFPVLVILVGVFLLFGRSFGATTDQAGDIVSSFVLFSGTELASHSAGFQGGRIGAVFGGAELDLRDATLAPEARLDVFAAFGGVEIHVPTGWRVDINGFPVFGGYDNVTAKEPLAADAPILHIDATVLFGGLDVKH